VWSEWEITIARAGRLGGNKIKLPLRAKSALYKKDRHPYRSLYELSDTLRRSSEARKAGNISMSRREKRVSSFMLASRGRIEDCTRGLRLAAGAREA